MPEKEYVTKDSGKREQHPTGMQRDNRTGKGRYELLPPIAIRRLAQLYERGAVKYYSRNWEKGGPLSRFMDSALRHIFQFLEGDREEDHLSGAVFNLFAVMHIEGMIERGLMPSELNDLPSYMPENDDNEKV